MPRSELPPSPVEVRSEMDDIQTLQEQFRVAKEEARQSGDFTQARALHQELLSRVAALEGKVNPFETRLHVRDQMAAQQRILETVGILETLPDGAKGIAGIDGVGYPLPSYQEISKRMLEKRELLGKKIEQGFTKLILVPFGMSLDVMSAKYKASLKKHFDEGNLLYTKENPTDPDEKVPALHTDGPLWVWDKYPGADKNGTLVYHPQKFDATAHGGKTKADLMAVNGGWSVLLVEEMPNIPRSGKAKKTGGREQIDTKGKQIKSYIDASQTIPSAHEYLKAMRVESPKKDSLYQGEMGMTPEAHMAYALTHLEETNQIIDDYQGKGSINWNVEAYFPASVDVSLSYWDRDARQANLDRDGAGDRDDRYGLRSAVGA